jgi:hypothetical protein
VSSPSSGSESRDHDPQAASGERLRPGSPERWPHLERVPPVTSPRHPCARDFFTVETLMIRTVYVLFAIEIWSRRVQILGVTRNPNSAWVTQQAGTLRWGKDLEGSGSRLGTEMPSTPVPSTRCSSPKRGGNRHHADPGSASERVRQAVGPHGPGRVVRLGADLQPPTPRAGRSHLCRALQRR